MQDSVSTVSVRGTTRRGKIGRLPKEIREQLNRALEEGKDGKGLVVWLNSQPEAQAVMVAEFGGVPVGEDNLTRWRHGGFLDWQEKEETLEATSRLAAMAVELKDATGGSVAGTLAECSAARVALWLQRLRLLEENPAQEVEQLGKVCRQAVALRRSEYDAERLKMEWERFAFEERKYKEQVEEQKRKRELAMNPPDAGRVLAPQEPRPK